MTADAKPAEPVRIFPAARHIPIDIGILQAVPDRATPTRRTYTWRPRHALHAEGHAEERQPSADWQVRNSRQA